MTVISDPEPGYYTDIMVWNDCIVRTTLEQIMDDRAAAGLPRLKLYADKLYNSGLLIVAAWSRRHGAVFPWMEMQNRIMSSIRIAVEWSFCTIKDRWKFLSFSKGQKLQESPVTHYHIVAALLANCHCCLYGGRCVDYFGIEAPSIEDYLGMPY